MIDEKFLNKLVNKNRIKSNQTVKYKLDISKYVGISLGMYVTYELK